MIARVLDVCDAVANLINREWGPTAPDAVTSEDFIPELAVDTITGRKVYVMPSQYGQAEVLDRASDLNEYRITIIIVEKYTVANGPTNTWVRNLMLFVQDQIYDRLMNHRDEPTMEDLMPESGSVTPYDYEMLVEAKMFVSEVEINFHKVESI